MEWLDVIDMMKKYRAVDDIDNFLNYVSKWPLFIHLISAAICMGLSTIYHLFFVYSPEAFLMLVKLDYTGITILFFGSTVPFIQYMFACNDVACKFQTINLHRSQVHLHLYRRRLLPDRLHLLYAASLLQTVTQVAQRCQLHRARSGRGCPAALCLALRRSKINNAWKMAVVHSWMLYLWGRRLPIHDKDPREVQTGHVRHVRTQPSAISYLRANRLLRSLHRKFDGIS